MIPIRCLQYIAFKTLSVHVNIYCSVSDLKAVSPKWSHNLGPKMAIIINKIALWCGSQPFCTLNDPDKMSLLITVIHFTVGLYRESDK